MTTATIVLRLTGRWVEIGNAVHYLVRDPVEETFDDFVSTWARTARERSLSRRTAVTANRGATSTAVALIAARAHFG